MWTLNNTFRKMSLFLTWLVSVQPSLPGPKRCHIVLLASEFLQQATSCTDHDNIPNSFFCLGLISQLMNLVLFKQNEPEITVLQVGLAHQLWPGSASSSSSYRSLFLRRAQLSCHPSPKPEWNKIHQNPFKSCRYALRFPW